MVRTKNARNFTKRASSIYSIFEKALHAFQSWEHWYSKKKKDGHEKLWNSLGSLVHHYPYILNCDLCILNCAALIPIVFSTFPLFSFLYYSCSSLSTLLFYLVHKTLV